MADLLVKQSEDKVPGIYESREYGAGASLEMRNSFDPREERITFSVHRKTTLALHPDHFLVNGIRVEPKTPEEAREVVDAFKGWLEACQKGGG